ncbi:hypothetical protein ACFP81_12935 [Deinococcus lacus]|uniref:DUF4230 domain-containing protein n=1 Tax=Deinococcus lacus TaxID=392561 RepID=A0ABW1YGY2_9DEIO
MQRSTKLLAALVLFPAAYYLYRVENPKEPLRPTDLRDGLGPVQHRFYAAEVIQATKTPEEIVAQTLQRLPEFAPSGLAWFRGLDHPVPPVREGDRLKITMMGLRRARVVVEDVTPLSFTIRTLRLHPDSGTVRFRAVPYEPGHYQLEVESAVRSSTHLDRAAHLAGVHAAQRANWETVLNQAAELSGGIIAGHTHRSQEYPYDPAETAREVVEDGPGPQPA